ncbi:MAG: hypothetical protein ACI3ZY_07100 [Parabacteroides sp.]
MRLLILSFFAALLGYSLLFDSQEVKQTGDLQKPSASSVLFAPNDMDSITYSSMNWLSVMPNFPVPCTKEQVFVSLK